MKITGLIIFEGWNVCASPYLLNGEIEGGVWKTDRYCPLHNSINNFFLIKEWLIKIIIDIYNFRSIL